MMWNQIRDHGERLAHRGKAGFVKWADQGVRVMLVCLALVAWGLLAAGCRTQEKKTTLKVEGPNSERKITLESRETDDRRRE